MVHLAVLASIILPLLTQASQRKSALQPTDRLVPAAVITMVHLAVLAFIIIAGLAKAKPSNLQPFAPYGARGIFSGAAYVYFTYTGFDAVATSAEEV